MSLTDLKILLNLQNYFKNHKKLFQKSFKIFWSDSNILSEAAGWPPPLIVWVCRGGGYISQEMDAQLLAWFSFIDPGPVLGASVWFISASAWCTVCIVVYRDATSYTRCQHRVRWESSSSMFLLHFLHQTNSAIRVSHTTGECGTRCCNFSWILLMLRDEKSLNSHLRVEHPYFEDIFTSHTPAPDIRDVEKSLLYLPTHQEVRKLKLFQPCTLQIIFLFNRKLFLVV